MKSPITAFGAHFGSHLEGVCRESSDEQTQRESVTMTEPNRYGAQDNRNDDGELCCCHQVALTQECYCCELLEKTNRQPTLVGVDPARMNPLNDDGGAEEDKPSIVVHRYQDQTASFAVECTKFDIGEDDEDSDD